MPDCMFVGMLHSTLELIMLSSRRDDDWDQAHDDEGCWVECLTDLTQQGIIWPLISQQY